MAEMEFFPQRPDSHPMIYAYEDTNPQYKGLLKVGYTSIDVDRRVAQQYPTKRPDGSVPYRIVLRESAMYPDGSSFTDHDVHRVLRKKQITGMGGEWFKCTVNDVKAAIAAVRTGTANVENRTQTFAMRPEQEYAVNLTKQYFESAYKEGSGRTPKFLWNAKMRFGKTFAAYQLAKKMGMKRVLILTFKPAVQTAWREDLMAHVDFEGWQFITRPTIPSGLTNDQQYQRADKSRPIVCFGSFQDFLGVNKDTGGIKANNEWVHATNWDLVIFDEYHFGAWGENAKSLFEQDDDTYEKDLSKYDRGNAYDETWLPITTDYYLYLSGTPFRALNSGEFIEEQIYNWTYSDEQRAKAEWKGEGENPYAVLPRMVMLTYKIPESIQRIAKQGEFDEFDLNVFFSAEGTGRDARFKYEDYVQKWLDLIRGSYLETSVDELKLGAQKPPIYTGIDKHTGEDVGLYSTVISRADYDAMAGQLAASMAADAPRADDIPDRPIFTNIALDDEEEDEPAEETKPAARSNKSAAPSRTPIVQPAGPAIGNTYRPAYIPPVPTAAPAVQKPKADVDTSQIHAGTIVTHKAFGTGQVKGIDGGLIVVTFAGVDKRFQFPGAFEQGFLKLE